MEQEREPTTNSTHMTPSPGIEPGSHSLEASAFTTCAIPAPCDLLLKRLCSVLGERRKKTSGTTETSSAKRVFSFRHDWLNKRLVMQAGLGKDRRDVMNDTSSDLMILNNSKFILTELPPPLSCSL